MSQCYVCKTEVVNTCCQYSERAITLCASCFVPVNEAFIPMENPHALSCGGKCLGYDTVSQSYLDSFKTEPSRCPQCFQIHSGDQ